MIFCGIDLGTGGARCALVDERGSVLAEAESAFESAAVAGLPRGWFEQEAAAWLEALEDAITAAVDGLTQRSESPGRIAAVSVTSTSGTLCVLDGRHNLLRRPIMYNDARSAREAAEVQGAGSDLAAALGYSFKPSFALPKILWVKNNEPELFEKAALLVSPTDFIIGWLTGSYCRTDQTNALKYGYDLLGDCWPDFIEKELAIPLALFPRVQMTGTSAGEVTSEKARQLGLPAGIPVAAGLTDGCASQISSGAVRPGEFNTTIGTTLVVKGVTRKLLLDPKGRLYCHKHPAGWWLPGGASNTGAECLAEEFGRDETELLSSRALSASPTDLVCYPLVGKGERFPFAHAGAEGFLLGRPRDRDELFAAYLEGVACIERLALELLEELGAALGDRIFSAGGGSRSRAWLQIRADMLNKTIVKPAATGGAMGAAIVAASMARYADLGQAVDNMVRVELECPPRAEFVTAYGEKYELFRTECARRGYIEG